MKKLSKVLGIIALVALIGFLIVGCNKSGGGSSGKAEAAEVDSTLNGGWHITAERMGAMPNQSTMATLWFKFENGTYEHRGMFGENSPAHETGTYTVKGSDITLTQTHSGVNFELVESEPKTIRGKIIGDTTIEMDEGNRIRTYTKR
ncbi:MAG: hypothetical protein FWC01_07365 [Treponema sp.]|nr:hypothetical protein [Treponema sp.]MCL2237662.1 hypothetical protein [Treponema sp.]